jgi:hypothetical protein
MDATEDPQKTLFRVAKLVIELIALIGALDAAYHIYRYVMLPNIKGHWTITTITTETRYRPYRDMSLTYNVSLAQPDDGTFSGGGEKIMENGDYITNGRGHVRTEYNGTVERNHIYGHLVEHGIRREFDGSFELHRISGDKWEGTFRCDAADSRGTMTMER